MAATLTTLVSLATQAAAEAPARPTFNKDVLPILQQNCQSCHRPKAIGTSGMVAPMALTTYEEARPWAKSMANAVENHTMPPWFATAEFNGVFRNERVLTQDEIDTLVKWSQTGAVRGNEADAPAPLKFSDSEWWLGEPDLVVTLPEPVWVGDEVEDWQPNIDVKLTEEMLPEGRWIRTVECIPGSEPVHHIVLFKEASEESDSGFDQQNIGGLAPGAEQSFAQEGHGIYLEKGTTLRVNMHYHKEAGPGTGVWDQSRIGFFFYPKEEEAGLKEILIEPVGSVDFEIPPMEDQWLVGAARTFDRPFRVLNYLPHTHLRGVSAEYVAFLPDGTQEKLLDVPNYDYNWQLYYEYPEPRLFPAGTRIEVKLIYDNSPDNPSNPDPTIPMGFGLETTNEMAFGWMYYSFEDEATPEAADDKERRLADEGHTQTAGGQ
jgi:mono/diheme cytochrome c family protein